MIVNFLISSVNFFFAELILLQRANMKAAQAVKDIKGNDDIINKTTTGLPRRFAAIVADILN